MKDLHLRNEKINIKRILVLLIMLILFFCNAKPVFAEGASIQLISDNEIKENGKYYKCDVKVWTNNRLRDYNITKITEQLDYDTSKINHRTSKTCSSEGYYRITNSDTSMGGFYIDKTKPKIEKCEITNDQYCAEAELTVKATDNMRNKKYNCI